MFDIGAPEFLVIAVVALVVLGPERLPEVMRKAGHFYREGRRLLNQYSGEAQRMLEEGMREVNEVSDSINTTWQEATAGADASVAAPAPPLLQLPPPLRAPETAAAAGPSVLPASHGDTRAEVEPPGAAYPNSPFALPRKPQLAEAMLAGLGLDGPDLIGLAPGEVEPFEAPEWPPIVERAQPQRGARAGMPAENGLGTAQPAVPAVAATPAAKAPAVAALHSPVAAPAGSNGHATEGAGAAEDGREVRRRTVVALYRTGDIPLERAAAVLEMSPAEFRALLKRM